MRHIPVLLHEVLRFIPTNSKIIVDWTLWHWWHSQKFCEKFIKAQIIWFDVDDNVLVKAKENLKDCENMGFVKDTYANVSKYLLENNLKTDFILLDLWLNWEHILDAERWFSIQQDWPLDMRFGYTKQTAYEIIQKTRPDELCDFLINYGDFSSKRATKIAYHISKNKRSQLMKTTMWLKKLLSDISISKKELTLIFQTLRIITNDEFSQISTFLENLDSCLNIGGRCAIMSYHSGEDRIVKQYFKRLEKEKKYTILTSKPIGASFSEINANRAARSVKMRVIERV